MRVVRTVLEMKELWGQEVGFVPTMGALHAGHASLVDRARLENDIVVASIFVNPTQFNDPKDLEKYPRTLDKDLELLRESGADFVFTPSYDELYADKYRYKLSESQLSQLLCGKSRPGHFDGVLTVVLKLLNIVKPKRAYFGEKDYQQLLLIQDMVRALYVDCEIIPCPTVRETDGLAMSSRNMRLSPAEREIAPRLFQILKHSATVEEAKHDLLMNGFRVDYVEEHFGRRFAACFLGEVRLIDNVKI